MLYLESYEPLCRSDNTATARAFVAHYVDDEGNECGQLTLTRSEMRDELTAALQPIPDGLKD